MFNSGSLYGHGSVFFAKLWLIRDVSNRNSKHFVLKWSRSLKDFARQAILS